MVFLSLTSVLDMKKFYGLIHIHWTHPDSYSASLLHLKLVALNSIFPTVPG